MKKILILAIVCMALLLAFNAFAFDGSRDEAMQVITSSLDDPQVSEWVKGKFGSKKVFLAAMAAAPDDTVQEAAQTFLDFQESGGDLETAMEAATWVYVIVLIASLVLVAMII